jgi:hypothetical protein
MFVASHPEAACGSQGCIAQESLIAIGKTAIGLSHKSQGAKGRRPRLHPFKLGQFSNEQRGMLNSDARQRRDLLDDRSEDD